MSKVAIIIPTYNEKENIIKLINSIFKLDQNVDIIIVDDNSPDGTANEVEKLKKTYSRLHLIKRDKKLGLGTAYISGFLYAEKQLNSKYIVTMDADFSHDPSSIPLIIKELDKHHVVIGSRYTEGGKVVDSPFIRRMISKTANFLTSNFLKLKVKDATSGFRGYDIEVLKKINYDNIFSDGYSFLVEIIYKISLIKDVRLKEIPIIFTDRKEGKSKISRKEIFKAVKTIFNLFLIKIFTKNDAIELIDSKYVGYSLINHLRLKFHVSRYNKVKKLLKNGNLLDIGCGRPAEFMNDMSFLIYIKREDSYGVDIKEINSPKYNFKKASVYNLPFGINKFDNVTIMEVVEHIEDLKKTFQEINRVLKPNGKLIIVTPDNNILWHII